MSKRAKTTTDTAAVSLTRRNVLTGIAAVAVAGHAAAAPAVDPIFAAIEAHRTAYEADCRAMFAEVNARETAEDQFGFAPSTLVHWRGRTISGVEIDWHRDRLIKQGVAADVVAREYSEKMAEYTTKEEAERAWLEKTGLAPLKATLDHASAADNAAALALCDIEPTTFAGVAALLAHVQAFNAGQFGRIAKGWRSDRHQWPETEDGSFAHHILENVANAAAKLTGAKV